MTREFLDRLYALANEAIKYIEEQEEDIVFPENNMPKIEVSDPDRFTMDENPVCYLIEVKKLCGATFYDKEGKEYDLRDLTVWGTINLADTIKDFNNENKDN